MKIIIPHHILKEAINNLLTPHDYAIERVGYFSGDLSKTEKSLIISDWFTFSNDHYERTNDVGARVGRKGMTLLMSKALKSNKSFIHFHLHEFQTYPTFSKTDSDSLQYVTDSLFRFSQANSHGALIMGSEYFNSRLWEKGNKQAMNHSWRLNQHEKELLND